MGASITLTLIEIAFPTISMGTAEIIPWACKVWPSNSFKMVDDVMNNGEPRSLQHYIDMIHMEGPSLMIVWNDSSPLPQLGFEMKDGGKDEAHFSIHQRLTYLNLCYYLP